jgi:tRNA(fMet)-specific endonuclease VapC
LTRFLLDTNVVSDLVRNPQGEAAKRIAEVGEAAVLTSIVVAAELRFGAESRGSARLLAQLERVMSVLPVLALESPADRLYGRLRTALEAVGQPIGGNDLLIAAHALALDCVLVTGNEREFRRVDGLIVENWLR